MSVAGLVSKWRQESLDEDTHPIEANTLQCCATELERRWHEHAHDAQWDPDECSICAAEFPGGGQDMPSEPADAPRRTGKFYTPVPSMRERMERKGVLRPVTETEPL